MLLFYPLATYWKVGLRSPSRAHPPKRWAASPGRRGRTTGVQRVWTSLPTCTVGPSGRCFSSWIHSLLLTTLDGGGEPTLSVNTTPPWPGGRVPGEAGPDLFSDATANGSNACCSFTVGPSPSVRFPGPAEASTTNTALILY